MWLRVWMALSVAGAYSQTAHTKFEQNGETYEWGWQLTPQQGGTAGHYYVKLPQSEQQVRYVEDGEGLRAAVSGPAPEAADQIPTQLIPVSPPNATLEAQNAPNNQSPVDIYLLPQQFSPFGGQLVSLSTPTVQFTVPNLYYNNNVATQQYSVQTLHPVQINEQIHEETNEKNESAQRSYEGNEERDHEHLTTNVVQVFKDHNCTNEDSNRAPKDYNINSKDTLAYAEVPNYDIHNINGNFGIKEGTERPLTYRGAVHFRVEPSQNNARSERYYFNQASTTVSTPTTEDARISRLVASTQDIISNEDLLKINHAVEKLNNVHNDDIIRPRPRNLKYKKTRYDNTVQASTPRSRITVRAKIGNIVDSEIEHLENNKQKEEVLQTNSNQYTFASPIVVQDTNYDNFKEQVVSNLVSTMVPYLQDGYEIVGVKNSFDENFTNSDYKEDTSGADLVNVTPRPISQKYLAPITVALRLFNANNTDTFNTIDDHDVSDSEVVTDTVKSPERERTVVEIQQSIPLDITHINDVEVHEYLDEGRSNDKGPLDLAKSLYHTYINALRSDTYEKNNRNNGKGEDHHNYAKDQLDTSENIQSEVEIRPNDATNERHDYTRYYNNYNHIHDQEQKVIQPIIIEKEVPVTKFVDRYISRDVQPETVIQHVPVDRPVPVPVPYEKIVDRPVEVTRYVDKPYPVEVPRYYPVEVPYPVEKKVYVDRPVHVPYTVEKVVEKQIHTVHNVPVPTPVAVPVEVEKQVLYPVPIETPVPYPVEVEKRVPVEKIVHKEVPVPYAVEKRVPYPVPYETRVPVPYPVEKRIPVPVERIVEKPVTVTKYVEKPVHIEVPVHIPQPYPVDRIVEKKVPYPVPFDRIVEKKVHVQVPYPVERVVEKPVVVTKYVDKPYPVEKRVPYPVEKVVEKKVPYPVQVPVGVKVPYPVEKNVDRPIYVPIRVPYYYEQPRSNSPHSESQNGAQYQRYTAEQHKRGIPPPHLNINEVQSSDQKPTQQNLHDKERQKGPIQSTSWGNLYATSYQYLNSTPKYEYKEFKKSPGLTNYIHYLTNNNNHRTYDYYGPPPVAQHDNVWEENKKYLVELKLRRADRTPKASNLRIEYGFKPPLIPSTEIDLDGVPVKKD